MGKKKNKKFGAAKPQPTGLPSINDDDVESEMMVASSSSSVVADVLDQLQSAEESSRECGCGTLAALASQSGALPVLLSNNVVRILAPLVIDPSPCVRHRALGALRNMTVDGGLDVCQEMVLKDVLTPLIALFKEYGANWEPGKSSTKHTDTQLDTFLQAVHVLWNLCEASDIAVTVFNKENLMPLLLPCLQYSVYGYPLATAVAQCLQTVTEENAAAVEVCSTENVLPALKALMEATPDTSSHAMLFKAALMGILLNVLGGDAMNGGSSLTPFLLTITHILQVSVPSLIAEYAARNAEQSGMSSMDASGDARPQTLVEEEVMPTDEQFQDILNTVDAQKLCLELVTNLCCSPEEEWEDLDNSESGSLDEMATDVDMVQDTAEDNNNTNPDVQICFAANGIMTKVLDLTLALPEDVTTVLNSRKWGQTLSKKLTRLRMHALLCVNNLVESLPQTSVEGTQDLHRLWDTLTLQLKTSGVIGGCTQRPRMDPDLLEATTGAMRAVIQRLALVGACPKFSDVTPADVQFLIGLGEGTTSSIQINVARIMATIAQLVVKANPTHTVVQEVGSCLLGVACHSGDVVVEAEALDCLFDVFGDDSTQPVARSLQLTQRLKDIMPQLKARLQSQKKSLGENYVTVATACTNLIRFIRYKESQGSC